MVLDKDFREFIALLNENDVRYLIVGGYAVGFHGYPRYTKDLDVWIEATTKNSGRVMKALSDFGFGSSGLSEADFVNEGEVIQLGYPPNRIDLVTSCEGVDFEECYASRNRIEVGGLTIDFIDIENLIKNKTAVGRPQDLADVSNLKS